MSLLSESGPPAQSPASECVFPLDPKEGEQLSLAGERVGGRNSDEWIESQVLCILCAQQGGPKMPLSRESGPLQSTGVLFSLWSSLQMLI
jgi:hypothetical protein